MGAMHMDSPHGDMGHGDHGDMADMHMADMRMGTGPVRGLPMAHEGDDGSGSGWTGCMCRLARCCRTGRPGSACG